MAKPADAAAEAIDAVRAVPTCPSTRFVDAGPTPSSMNVLKNYCVAVHPASRDSLV